MYDLILKGGSVFNGTSSESFIGDVAIKDGVIVAVEPDGRLKLFETDSAVSCVALSCVA